MAKINTPFNKKSFWNKISFKYKLSILNEKTLEEVWSLRLSFLSGIVFIISLFVVVTLLVSTLIVKTPLKNFLPGYLDINMRRDIVTNALKMDELEAHLNKQNRYLSGLKEIISGNIKADSIASVDSLAVIVDQKALEKSSEEVAFVQKFEDEERYNLSNVVGNKEVKTLTFFRPCRGTPTSRFVEGTLQTGVQLAVASEAPVSTVLDGTIVYSAMTLDQGYVVQIQHVDNFISIYRNLNTVSPKVGRQVKAGEVVGLAKKEKEGTTIQFELWYNGKSVDPENYIKF